MTDKHKQRVKRFGDKLAKDNAVMAHVVTVWYENGDVDNNWSGIGAHAIAPAPFLLTDDDDDNAHS